MICRENKLKLPSPLKFVAALPCEMLMVNSFTAQLILQFKVMQRLLITVVVHDGALSLFVNIY